MGRQCSFRSSITMQGLFGILVLSLFAGGSCATDCFSRTKVNTSLLSGGYTQFCEQYAVPCFEFGDHYAKTFRDEFTEAIASRYGHKIAVILLRQAKAGGRQLIDDVQRSIAKLEKSIKLISDQGEKKIRLDDHLNQLTRQLWVFLDLHPGDLPLEESVLPDLPEQQLIVKNRNTPRPLSDLFVNFMDVVDGVFGNLYAYITGVFLNGWAKSRPYFKVFVAQFRNEILNGPVLEAYRKTVNEVYRQRDVIRSHVKEGTWKYFTDAGVRIINISDEYNKSKNEQICV